MKKVLIVDDSALIRKILRNTISQSNDFEVIGHAKDGKDALEKISALNPDIVTLDIDMPGMDGLQVLSRIMKDCPVPVIIISAHTAHDSKITFKALEMGAVDFLLKPQIHNKQEFIEFQEKLINKITVALFSKPKGIYPTKKKLVHKFARDNRKILLIGASTGGPSTIQRLLVEMPGNLPFPILIVQHMPALFTKFFAERLNKLCDFHVKEAEDGDEVKNNVAYICPGDFHMLLDITNDGKHIIRLNRDEKVNNVRPNFDYLVKSVVPVYGNKIVIVVLTGMGRDGTEGARLVKKHGGVVVTEAEESCVLYGMPKSIIDNNLADVVVGIDKMPVSIIQKIEL